MMQHNSSLQLQWQAVTPVASCSSMSTAAKSVVSIPSVCLFLCTAGRSKAGVQADCMCR